VPTSLDQHREYEPPAVYDLGSVVRVTHGSGPGINDINGQGYS
jgi:hypothetical protein